MLESLQQADQQLLLFLNGIHSPFWDSFMWIFTAKMTWIPMYAAILYVLLKNFRLSVSLITVLAIALTITYADQICATVIRPCVERLRPSNPQNPISELIHLVNGKRGGRYGFPSCHAANSFALAFFVMRLLKKGKTLPQQGQSLSVTKADVGAFTEQWLADLTNERKKIGFN